MPNITEVKEEIEIPDNIDVSIEGKIIHMKG